MIKVKSALVLVTKGLAIAAVAPISLVLAGYLAHRFFKKKEGVS